MGDENRKAGSERHKEWQNRPMNLDESLRKTEIARTPPIDTPPVDTSTAGKWTQEYVSELGGHFSVTHQRDRLIAQEHNTEVAALREQLRVVQENRAADQNNYTYYTSENETLREQLAQVKRKLVGSMDDVRSVVECAEWVVSEHDRLHWKNIQVEAALKQKNDALQKAEEYIGPVGHPVSREIARALAIQPDSTALQTFIEAETAKLRGQIREWAMSLPEHPQWCWLREEMLAASIQKVDQP